VTEEEKMELIFKVLEVLEGFRKETLMSKEAQMAVERLCVLGATHALSTIGAPLYMVAQALGPDFVYLLKKPAGPQEEPELTEEKIYGGLQVFQDGYRYEFCQKGAEPEVGAVDFDSGEHKYGRVVVLVVEDVRPVGRAVTAPPSSVIIYKCNELKEESQDYVKDTDSPTRVRLHPEGCDMYPAGSKSDIAMELDGAPEIHKEIVPKERARPVGTILSFAGGGVGEVVEVYARTNHPGYYDMVTRRLSKIDPAVEGVPRIDDRITKFQDAQPIGSSCDFYDGTPGKVIGVNVMPGYTNYCKMTLEEVITQPKAKASEN